MKTTSTSNNHMVCKTWHMSEHVQSVSTNRTEGQIKLHVAPREILEQDKVLLFVR